MESVHICHRQAGSFRTERAVFGDVELLLAESAPETLQLVVFRYPPDSDAPMDPKLWAIMLVALG